VIRFSLLYVRMLRYRVATMLWMFLLLAAAYREGLSTPSWDYLWSTLALASCYVAATALNDVANRDIDRVNHPRDAGRPLVSGDATERDLLRLHVVAAALALVAALPLGWGGIGVVLVSLAIAVGYSLPPLTLSHRTLFAPFVLAVAYVLVPYTHGLLGADVSFTAKDITFMAALFALFIARIVLKDFRDRDGDARYGKPTLLLRAGKTVTCLASVTALAVGNVLLLLAVRPPAPVAVVLELFICAVAWMLLVLHRAVDRRDEQVAIGIGARMANGVLITTLATLLLDARGATAEEQLGLVSVLAVVFGVSFLTLVARPQDAVLGYKG
jgi:1,4-dihydroxy-2-naphthoate polyprenyltransferase